MSTRFFDLIFWRDFTCDFLTFSWLFDFFCDILIFLWLFDFFCDFFVTFENGYEIFLSDLPLGLVKSNNGGVLNSSCFFFSRSFFVLIFLIPAFLCFFLFSLTRSLFKTRSYIFTCKIWNIAYMTLLSANQIAYIFRANDNLQYVA